MDEDIRDAIREELTHQAAQIPDRPVGLAAGAISEARSIRRRQVLGVAIPVSVAAAAAMSIPYLVARPSEVGPVTTGAPPTPATTSASASSAPTDGLPQTSIQPSVPIVSGSNLIVDGRTVTLPDGWAVLSMVWTGQSVVLDVTSLDRRFVAISRGAGPAREVSGIVPPFAVNADGGLLAGLEPSKTVDTSPSRPAALLIMDLSSGSVTKRLQPAQQMFPERFLGPTGASVLLSQQQGPLQRWAVDSALIGDLAIPVGTDQLPLAVDSSGTLFLTTDKLGHVLAQRLGAKSPEWTSTVVADGPGAMSSDDSMVALSSNDTLVVLDARSGSPISQSGPLRGMAPWRFTWESDSSIIAADPAAVEGGLLRCEARTAKCSKIVPDVTMSAPISDPPAPVVASVGPTG